jgi:hypothetical protein
MEERERKIPTLFDEINSYLKKEAPKDIEKPTIEGIAERLGTPGDVLTHWLDHDRQFREELTRLKEFQTKDPFNEGNEFDYLFIPQESSLFWTKPRNGIAFNPLHSFVRRPEHWQAFKRVE